MGNRTINSLVPLNGIGFEQMQPAAGTGYHRLRLGDFLCRGGRRGFLKWAFGPSTLAPEIDGNQHHGEYKQEFHDVRASKTSSTKRDPT